MRIGVAGKRGRSVARGSSHRAPPLLGAKYGFLLLVGAAETACCASPDGSTLGPGRHARYYFVVSCPLGSEADPNGLELPGDAEARDLALRAVIDIRTEDPRTDFVGWHVEMRDGSGNLMLKVPVEPRTWPSSSRACDPSI